MTARRHSQHNAARHVDTPGPLPSSGDVHAPPDATPTRPAVWPIGGTGASSRELDHLIHEIDDVFGFSRRRKT